MLASAMNSVIGIAWTLVLVLKYASIAILLAGVFLFGRNLLRAAAPGGDHKNESMSPAIWQAPAARLSFKLLGGGAGLMVLSVLLAWVLPGRL